MKPGIPWSVKGIEPDVREAAKQAARRSGMTLGEWLNSAILENADYEEEPPRRGRQQQPPRNPRDELPSRRPASATLDDIAAQLAELSRRETGSAQHLVIADEDERSSTNDALKKILTRVESNERQTVEAFTAVNDRLSILGRQMAQAMKPNDGGGIASLEKAVRNIVEHMEASEKRTRENLKSLHDRISGMSTKAANATNEQVLKQAPAFSQLENRLSDLAKRLEKQETNAAQPQPLPDLLKQELTELAGRIDSVRDTAESLAHRAQTQAVQSSQQELRAIEQRIVGLIREAQASLAGNTVAPAEIQRLRSEIERLNGRIDEAQRAQASGGDVMALRAAVEQLSTRVAQGPDMRPLADMDRRILDITQRLEQTQAQTRTLPQFGELERRIAELDHKLNEAVSGRGSAAAQEIEDRMGEIASRVDRAEQQLASMETIERAINQIYDTMEQQKGWTQQVANEAANRMAQNLLAMGPQQVSLAGAPEIQALQEGLHAVRAAAESADHRNQETLEAVHETLEQIVGKLAELETAAIGQRVAAAAQPNAQPVMAQISNEPPVQWQNIAAPAPEPARDVFAAEAPAPAMSGISMAAPSNPLEGMAAPAAAAAIDSGDDFIAAARRAAQASYQQKGTLGGMTPPPGRASPEKAKKGFSLFSRKSGEAKIAAIDTAKPANSNEKRRKLLLMGLVLLAAVSAFTFNIMGHKSGDAPATPAAVEQPADTSSAAPGTAAPAAAGDAAGTPAQGDATPPVPKPEVQGSLETAPGASDPLLTTGSLQPSDDAGTPTTTAESAGIAEKDMPPAEVGTMKLRESAALGNPQAQFVVATRYLNGENGVKQDFGKAAFWYGKAAAQGLAPAQYRLGTLYERGKGVARDSDTALKWYERAASLGNIKAMHNAAVLAAGSDSRSPDYKRAFKWFSLGAAHGLKDSQFNLAVLLERGLGTKANPAEALFWYSLAAKQNDADAKRRADALIPQISSAEQQATQSRIKSWVPDSAPDGANVVAVSQPDWNSENATGG